LRALVRVRASLKFAVLFAVVGFVLAGGQTTVQGQATRTWVSGVGDDANPCSRTAPCKTFAGAISKTAAHGEINCLDPGGFGAVTITKSITIDCDGFTGGILAAGFNGVIVNATNTDVVTLRGLSINGAGTGLTGVNLINAGILTIENCEIFGFRASPARGIFVNGGAAGSVLQLDVHNTIVRDNGISVAGAGGIVLGNPTATALGAIRAHISDSVLTRNNIGLRVHPTTSVEVSHTVATANITNNFLASSGGAIANLNIDASSASESVGGTGITATGAGAVIRLSNTQVQGNNIGLEITGGGSILSYHNNMIGGNFGGDGPVPPTIPLS